MRMIMERDDTMAGYIMELRKYVGHAPLIQTAGSVIVEDEKGRILLGRRTDNHLWGYAGGSIELGESIEDCAKRELREEMGLIAEKLELLCVNSGEETHYIYPNGDEVYNVEVVYVCRRYHGEIVRQEEEMEELRFFLPEEIDLNDISDPIRPVIRTYLETRRQRNAGVRRRDIRL